MNESIQRLEGRALAWIGEIINRTARIQFHGWDQATQFLESGRPTIFAAWHGQNYLLFPLLRNRIDPTRLVFFVVADHRQIVLESFVRAIGVESFPIQSDSESFSGGRNVVRLIQTMKSGKYTYITPDGPDGPARQAKPGIAYIATRTEAQIIPMGGYTPTAYYLNRWDRYTLPMPFSRICGVARPPILVSKDMDRSELILQINTELTAAMREAESLMKG